MWNIDINIGNNDNNNNVVKRRKPIYLHICARVCVCVWAMHIFIEA